MKTQDIPCTCGGWPYIHGQDYEDTEGPWFVECAFCGRQTVAYAYKREAWRAWKMMNKGPEMKTHILKTWPVFFADVEVGAKKFEIRRNDRGFQVGDTLILEEYDPKTKRYSGNKLHVRVTYTICLDSIPGIPPGFIGMGIEQEAPE